MVVIHKQGDVFTTEQPVIGHGCNTIGMMGAGVASIVRKRYPSVYKAYTIACNEKLFVGGETLLLQVSESEHNSERYIANIGSQVLPGANADLQLLRGGFKDTLVQMEEAGLSGIAIPEIGAGIGGLQWEDVLSVVEEESSHYPHITVEVWHFDS